MYLARTFLLVAVGMFHLAGAGQLSAAPAAPETSSSPTPLTRELFLGNLARDLSAHFNLEGDLQLELLRTWASPAQVASVWEISVLEYPSVATSSMMVRCRVLADSVAITDATFVLRASLWRDAWAARQPVAPGATFDPAILETRRTDMFRERDVLPASVGDATYVFTRSVGAGRLLTWRDISLRPLVKKGALVDVSAVDGFLLVTMKALAMESGARGDTVTVRNPESRKDFSATVIDENRVQVRF
jgi:flagellar basal body P-ring formation protein FlgA